MATHQPGNAQGIVDPQRAVADSAAVSDSSVSTPANYDSQADMDTRLIAIGYSQSTLDSMTNNDKMYAIRLNDDADTF